MCNKHLQQKKKKHKLKCVLSLSLSLSPSLSLTHTQFNIHAQGKYCNLYVDSIYIEYYCSVGSFGAKFIFIFDTFVFLNT